MPGDLISGLRIIMKILGLDMANSVAVAVYEALRRSDFAELEHAGRFAAGGKNV